MDTIIEYRSDVPPTNEYPRRIVSPCAPSACCLANKMVQVGLGGIDAHWRFYYKRCPTCGYTVRCFYAPSLLSIFETGREIRIALAEMNLEVGGRKRRSRTQLAADRAAARAWPFRARTEKLVPSPA